MTAPDARTHSRPASVGAEQGLAPTASDPTGPTGRLAAFLAETSLDDLPPEVVTRTKHLVLDGVGCGLLAARLPWSVRAVEVMTDLDGDGAATVWGWGRQVPPGTAALLNGTAIQGFELDDYHPFGPLHSQACVLPAVLAMAEHEGGRSGRDVLEAVALGFETGPRVGMALGGLALVAQGWHCGSVYGALASAAGVGALLDLDDGGFEDAIGLAATQASGLMSAQFEAMVKRMHSGIAARTGLTSAALAARGFSGIKRVIEREYGGFASTFSEPDEVDLGQLTEGLGERWEIARIAAKPPYACMAGLHATVDAVREVTSRGVGPDDVASIRIGVSDAIHKHAGWSLERPAEVIGAQMNLAYAAAVTLLDGEAFVPQFSPQRIAADDVWDLIARVEVGHDPDIDRLGSQARWTSRLVVELTDGTQHALEVRHPWGGHDRPLSDGELRDKFRRMAGVVIDDRTRIDALEATILHLEEEHDPGRLRDLLASPVASPFVTGAP